MIAVVNVSSTVADLRSTSCTVFPLVEHQSCTVTGCFSILSTISNCPVTVIEMVVGNCNIVRAYAVVASIRPVCNRSIDPDELTYLNISVMREGCAEVIVVEPDVSAAVDVNQNNAATVAVKLSSTEVEVLENDIITWSNTRIAVVVVISPLSIENGVCSI